jgi:hypothetical protein
MRRLFIVMAFGVASVLGSAAQAGPLQQGSLTFVLGTNDPLVFTGDGTSAGTATSATNFTLGAGKAFAGSQTIMLTPTAMQPLSQITITIGSNQKGTFSGSPVAGSAVFTGTAINKALGSTLLKVPVSLGKTGTIMATGSGIKVTAFGKKWTSGMTTVDLGGANGTVMATGSVNGSKALKLVAISKIVTNLGIVTSAVGQLSLDYGAPEPAMPLLLVAGAATLALAGAKKLRRR